ncbi:unnamed protein product, partial [Allacma fusca]
RVVDHMSNLANRNPRPLPHYEGPTDSKGDFPYREQLYSTLPCPPFHPNTIGTNRVDTGMFPEMEDISPYATFQLSDPLKKFHEEGFSQDIVVPKFYDVMQQQTYSGIRGDPRLETSSAIYGDRWVRRRKSGLGSEDEEDVDEEEEEDEDDTGSEEGLRYSALPLTTPVIETKKSNNGRSNSAHTPQLRLQSHFPHQTILHQSHHLSFPCMETKAGAILPTPSAILPDTSNNYNNPRSFPGLELREDSSSPETSPPLHHPNKHLSSSKKRVSSHSKKWEHDGAQQTHQRRW